MDRDDALIQLDGVSFAYEASRPVLREASLALRAGQRLALLGANGSGKTTLLHLIVGLIKPDAGSIIAFGRPRRAEADFNEVRRRAGLVFQNADDQLFCPTVLEDVAFGPLNLGLPADETRTLAADTLARLGLEDYADRITYKLSGGEKRLVAVATVLAMKPEVLLLDEPTSGLDDASARRLLDQLGRLDQAMIIVTHNATLLNELATDIYALVEGALRPATQPQQSAIKSQP